MQEIKKLRLSTRDGTLLGAHLRTQTGNVFEVTKDNPGFGVEVKCLKAMHGNVVVDGSYQLKENVLAEVVE